MKTETCWACGQTGFYILYSPMRCYDCVKNGIDIRTSPVKDAYWLEVKPNEEQ